jgi:hypothetical protein
MNVRLSRLLPVLFLLAGSTPAGPETEYARAKRKIDSIAQERVRPGATVSFTASEINAYVRTEAAGAAPQGLRNLVIRLPAEARATGEGLVDFSLLSSGESAGNRLLRALLEGERPVTVSVSVESGGGSALVRIERVEISGVAIEGRALEFLLDNFVRPRYPDAKIGEPFPLRHNMEAILVRPGRVDVKIKDQRRAATRPATSRPMRTQSGMPMP